MTDVILDVLLDTAKILPFLFLTYLVMEYLEHRMSGRAAGYLAQAEKKGPFIGAAVGVIPQCGFSATAAGFYSGGLITAGTLLAVFLSTSDEMIPVMLGSSIPVTRILKILAWKVVIACISGFAADLLLKNTGIRTMPGERIDELCHEDNCSCGEHNAGIFRPALRHTVKTALFLFLISLISFCMLLQSSSSVATLSIPRDFFALFTTLPATSFALSKRPFSFAVSLAVFAAVFAPVAVSLPSSPFTYASS